MFLPIVWLIRIRKAGSYNLPKSLLNTLTLKDASIFFQAENMLTLAKQQGLDPEQTFGTSSTITFICGILFLNETATPSKLIMFGFIVVGLIIFTAGSFKRQREALPDNGAVK